MAIAKTDTLSSSTKGVSATVGTMNCVVAAGTHIDGSFSSQESIRLDGSLKGDLTCDKKLVMGQGSRLEGSIKADEAVIMGLVTGELLISNTLYLQNSAVVQGNIKAKYLVVEEGAVFNGQCHVSAT